MNKQKFILLSTLSDYIEIIKQDDFVGDPKLIMDIKCVFCGERTLSNIHACLNPRCEHCNADMNQGDLLVGFIKEPDGNLVEIFVPLDRKRFQIL